MTDHIEILEDLVTASLINRYNATIGVVDTGDNTPLGLHWCLALPKTRTDQLGSDGHPLKGGFLPSVSLPRRMRASSEVEFLSPLSIGDSIRRISKVVSVANKKESSGELVFVTVEHDTVVGKTTCVRENQTLVYRESAENVAILPPDTGYKGSDCNFTETLLPNPQMLFRYSALTFNSHRIHYDQDYAQEEGYPALVVHGPLMASLLLRFASENIGYESIKKFSFQGRSPAYCDHQLHLGLKLGQSMHDLTVSGADGRLVLSASIET